VVELRGYYDMVHRLTRNLIGKHAWSMWFLIRVLMGPLDHEIVPTSEALCVLNVMYV
jgi:hypothetical protein